MSLEAKGKWDGFRESWEEKVPGGQEGKLIGQVGPWSVWSRETVEAISHLQSVESVIALGSVMAVELHDDSSAGKHYQVVPALSRGEECMLIIYTRLFVQCRQYCTAKASQPD